MDFPARFLQDPRPPGRAGADKLTPLLCLAMLLALLLALVLSELRQLRQAVGHDIILLRRDVHHLLDRPNLLDADHFDALEALGQDAAALSQRLLAPGSSVSTALQRQQIEAVAQALTVLAHQGQAITDLAQLTGRLAVESGEAGEGAEALRSLSGMGGGDASSANLARLRSFIDKRLARARASDAAGVPVSAAGVVRPPAAANVASDTTVKLQKALLLVDLIRTRRTEALSSLDAAPSPLWLSALLVWGLAGLAGLLALTAGLRWNRSRIALRNAAAPAATLRSSWADRTDLPVLTVQPGVAPAPPALRSGAVPAPPPPPVLGGVLLDDGQWRDLRQAVGSAFAASCAVSELALKLLDAAQASPRQARDDLLLDLAGLADQLRAAREGAVNLALSLLAESADDRRVAALERLDEQLMAILGALSGWQAQQRQAADSALPSTLVVRTDLVQLQSELQHLSDQLGALRDEVDAEPEGPGQSAPTLAAWA